MRNIEIRKSPLLQTNEAKKRLPGFLFAASLRIRRVVMPHNFTNKKYCSQLLKVDYCRKGYRLQYDNQDQIHLEWR